MNIPISWPKLDTKPLESAVVEVWSAIPALGALLPAAWITAERLITYLAIYGPAACVMAGAIELLGLKIVEARTALIGRDMPEQTHSMNMAFAGYLIIIVSVNGVLALAHLWNFLDYGKALAELILGLMALPVAALMSVDKQLRAIDTRDAALKAEQAQARVDERDERERVEDRASAQVLALRQMELEAQATENDKKRAERTKKAESKPAKVSVPSEVYPKDRRKLTPAQKDVLSKMSAKEISEKVGVSLKSGQNWLKEWSVPNGNYLP